MPDEVEKEKRSDILKGVLQAVAGYASFDDSDLKENTIRLLNEINADLIEEEYEPSPKTLDSADDLDEELNRADEEEQLEKEEDESDVEVDD
jgi:hypothetical protein